MGGEAALIWVLLVAYVGVCFGKIAAKHGKNQFLYGILSIISPINLILLGYWAFSDFERPKAKPPHGLEWRN